MIEKLSAEQEVVLAQVRDEWTAVGLSTEPADRPAAEEEYGRRIGVRVWNRRAS